MVVVGGYGRTHTVNTTHYLSHEQLDPTADLPRRMPGWEARGRGGSAVYIDDLSQPGLKLGAALAFQ